MDQIRNDSELPEATSKWGWKFHHLGIPTSMEKEGDSYIEKFKFHVSGFATSPFGIEWMRFDADSPIDRLIQTVPHLAFEVDDVESEIAKHKLVVLTEPNSPSPGVTVAMIVHNGAPVELLSFS
jgi:hypothetical protein